MPITYQESDEYKVLEIHLSERITKEMLQATLPQVEQFIQRHSQVKVLEVVRDFKVPEMAALVDVLKFDRLHIKSVTHCAVVTDQAWVKMAARFASYFLSLELRSNKCPGNRFLDN